MSFHPRGELDPQGSTLSPQGEFNLLIHSKGVNTLYYLEERGAEQRVFTLGGNFTLEGQLHPLGSHFDPRGEIKNRPLKESKAKIFNLLPPFNTFVNKTNMSPNCPGAAAWRGEREDPGLNHAMV
jgi:hypothetical protein